MFTLSQLNYGYNELKPMLDAKTVEIHYSKHHRGYTDKLNAALENLNVNHEITIEELLKQISKYNVAVRNNAGGFYNHGLYWTVISPNGQTEPRSVLLGAIQDAFGSLKDFLNQFKEAALTQFGPGWAWLSIGENEELFVSSTPNQDNPLMDVVPNQGTPILGIDVWEHAYYLKYQNNRGAYIDAFIKRINWDEVSRRYAVLL